MQAYGQVRPKRGANAAFQEVMQSEAGADAMNFDGVGPAGL
jgi:hypothetical protein